MHSIQYPLDMGRKKDSSSGIRTLRVKQNESATKIVYSQQKNLVRMILNNDKEDDDKHTDIEETTQPKKSVVNKIFNVRLCSLQPKRVQARSQEDLKVIKYSRSEQPSAFNSGTNERIIKMVEVNSLDPPMYRHKKNPKS